VCEPKEKRPLFDSYLRPPPSLLGPQPPPLHHTLSTLTLPHQTKLEPRSTHRTAISTSIQSSLRRSTYPYARLENAKPNLNPNPNAHRHRVPIPTHFTPNLDIFASRTPCTLNTSTRVHCALGSAFQSCRVGLGWYGRLGRIEEGVGCGLVCWSRGREKVEVEVEDEVEGTREGRCEARRLAVGGNRSAEGDNA
jgi:hypothetical protein